MLLGVDPEKSNERGALVYREVPPTLSEDELKATFRARQAPAIYGVPLFTRGTSYTLGAGATGGIGYSDLLAQSLGSSVLHNGGLGGTQAVSLCYQYVDDDEKWVPGTSTGVVVIESGVGETLNETAAGFAQRRFMFEGAITTALRWHRASAARKADHSSITLGPGASRDTIDWLSAVALAPAIKLEGSESFTITIGPGVHEIALLTVPWRLSDDASRNGDFTITAGGVTRKATTKGKGDPRPDGSNVNLTLNSERITGLNPGDVVTVTKTGGTEVWFWGYLEMANPTPPAICLMLDVYLNESSGQWTGSAITPGPMVNNKTLDVYRDIMRRVAASAEFADGTVVVADPNPYFDPTVDLHADGVHPGDSGHDKYRRAALLALQRISG